MKKIDKLFIVLRPQGKVEELAASTQKKINDEYKIYNGILPMLHITLAEIEGDFNQINVNKVKELLEKIAGNHKPVKLILDGFHCFFKNSKALTLELDETDSLVDLTEKLHEKLKEVDFLKINHGLDKINYHITLAGSMFADKPLSTEIHRKLCSYLEEKSLRIESETDLIELWLPVLEEEKAVLSRFHLSRR